MNRTEPLKTVISGMGRIAWAFHMPTLWKDPRFRLIAAVDPVPERRAEAEAMYPGLRTYADFSTMLRGEPEAELAVVTSPTPMHRDQSIEAMEHGLDVFCEKPLAESLDSARAIADAVERTGRRFMVFQPHRERPESKFMRDLRASGKIGRIFLVRRVSHSFNRRADWQSQIAKGGGMIRNYGVHYMDQFLSVFGPGPLTLVGASLQHAVGIGDADDVTQLLLRTPEGVVGHIDINLGCAYQENMWYAYGEYGSVEIDTFSGKGRLRRLDKMARHSTLALDDGYAAKDRKYGLETNLPWIDEEIELPPADLPAYYNAVWDYYAQGGEPVVPLADSLEVMRLIELARAEPVVSPG